MKETGSGSSRRSDGDDPQHPKSEDEEPVACEPCRQIRFAFGRDGHHFFYVRDRERIQWKAFLPNSTLSGASFLPGRSRGDSAYTVAISADGGILLAAKKDDGSPMLHYAGPTGPDSAFELAYKTLWDAIFYKGHLATDQDAQHLNIALGPHGSYYCATKDEPIWRDIPADLQASIAESAASASNRKKPWQVALGIHDTWVCIWSDHSHSHNLGSHYPRLAANLDQKMQQERKGLDEDDDSSSSRVAFVALNPWRTDSWLMADCDGLIVWENAPADTDRVEAEAVRDAARDYMQRRARQTGAQFTTSFAFGDGGGDGGDGGDPHHPADATRRPADGDRGDDGPAAALARPGAAAALTGRRGRWGSRVRDDGGCLQVGGCEGGDGGECRIASRGLRLGIMRTSPHKRSNEGAAET
ncbi:hypothetical protein PG993_000228 [Apiospora rasikravindrae]|uniref:Uncharacterized protein n=1 Tax=Apiospora rasikravindrae TaxID=990691 RepID=A0ABR1U7W7_9PEZI